MKRAKISSLLICSTLFFNSACQTSKYKSWTNLSGENVNVQCKNDSYLATEEYSLVACRFHNQGDLYFQSDIPKANLEDHTPMEMTMAETNDLVQQWEKKREDQISTALAVILVVGVIALAVAAKDSGIKYKGKSYRVKAVQPLIPVDTAIDIAYIAHMHDHHHNYHDYHQCPKHREDESYEEYREQMSEKFTPQLPFSLAPGETKEVHFVFKKEKKAVIKQVQVCLDDDQTTCSRLAI